MFRRIRNKIRKNPSGGFRPFTRGRTTHPIYSAEVKERVKLYPYLPSAFVTYSGVNFEMCGADVW
jgi:hypothetical protein